MAKLDQRWIVWLGGKPHLGPPYGRQAPTRDEIVEFVWKNYNRVVGPTTEVLLSRMITVEPPACGTAKPKEA